MRRLSTLLLLSLSFAAVAGLPDPVPEAMTDQQPIPAPVLEAMTDEQLANQFTGRVEVRLDVDFNADGDVDTAAVMRDDDAETRRLVVAIGYREETDMGFDPIGEMTMDAYPLADATLSVKKGVLLVEDLTGGTSAVASTYRFRFDPAQRRMRLIGDDVQYYSRTNNHDSIKISTNRLTGLRIRSRDKLTDAGDYAPQPEVREKLDTAPLYLDTAPAPGVTLGLDGE